MQPKPTLLRRMFGRFIAGPRRFARDDRGVTAVEFGILALPFFTIVFAILETAMVFFAGQVLDSAVEDASRLVKTGQGNAYNLGTFRTYMCGYTFNLFDCDKIRIKVDKIADFASTTTSQPVWTCQPNGKCDWAVTESFSPGKGREVIQVFAYYRWPLLVTLPYFNLKNQADNYRLLGATRVFRNEPFATP